MTARRLSHDDKIRIARGAHERFVRLCGDEIRIARIERARHGAYNAGAANAYAVQLAELVRELEAS